VRAFIPAAFALAALSSACAHYEALAVGEALTVGDRRVSPALALEAAGGSGSSHARGSVFLQTRGRALVGATRQQIAAFGGLSNLRWIGRRAPLWLHVDVGPGLEHYSGTIFFEAIAHARAGTGFILGELVEPYAALNPFGAEAQPFPREPWLTQPLPAAPQVVRRRILLTLGLAGDIDARFTRDPLYVVALMIGVARVEEIRRSP